MKYVKKKCGYCRKIICMVPQHPDDPDKPRWGICGNCGDELTKLDSMQPGDGLLRQPLTGRELAEAIVTWTIVITWVLFGFFLMVYGAISLYQKYHHA